MRKLEVFSVGCGGYRGAPAQVADMWTGAARLNSKLTQGKVSTCVLCGSAIPRQSYIGSSREVNKMFTAGIFSVVEI